MRRDTAAVLLLLLVTLAVYWPVGGHAFLDYDDNVYITGNPHVRPGLTGSGIAWAFTSTEQANWHPLTWLSHQLDVRLFGLRPRGHHLASLFLHLANVLLLFLVLRRMSGARWRSVLVAALFALHPLHVESVAWVAERKDVLSTFFGLLTLLAYAAYAGRPSRGRYALALAAFALGLMAKPMLVTLPFVLLLLDGWPLGRVAGGGAGAACPPGAPGDGGLRRAAAPAGSGPAPGRGESGGGPLSISRLVLEKAPFLALAAMSGIVTIIAQQRAGAIGAAEAFPLWSRVINAPVACLRYVGQMVWPSRLAVLYPHPGAGLSPGWGVLAGLVLLGVTIVLLRGARRRPWLAVGWLWFLGMLVPVIGLVQVGVQAGADRYTYVPLVGLFIVIAWGGAELAGRWRGVRRLPAALAVVMLAALAVVTRVQLDHWKDSASLFTHTLRVTSGNYVIQNNLGLVRAREGRLDEAEARFREALRIRPDYAEAHHNLGNVLADRGRPEEAVVQYAEALRLQPDRAQTLNNRGTVLLEQGRLEEAADSFRAALRLRPDHAAARCNLGLALERQEKPEAAMAEYREALRSNPGFAPAHHGLGIVLARLGRWDEAAAEFREVLRIDPGDAAARRRLAEVQERSGGAPTGGPARPATPDPPR